MLGVEAPLIREAYRLRNDNELAVRRILQAFREAGHQLAFGGNILRPLELLLDPIRHGDLARIKLQAGELVMRLAHFLLQELVTIAKTIGFAPQVVIAGNFRGHSRIAREESGPGEAGRQNQDQHAVDYAAWDINAPEPATQRMAQHDHETFLPCHDHKIFRFHSKVRSVWPTQVSIRTALGEGQNVTIREICVKSNSYRE
jgi:hypothetical protein